MSVAASCIYRVKGRHEIGLKRRGIRTPNHQRTRTLSIRFQGGQRMIMVADSRTSRRVTCGINLGHKNRASRT